MTNPFEELAARMDQRMDRIEALLLERDSRRPEPVLVETEDLLSVGPVSYTHLTLPTNREV